MNNNFNVNNRNNQNFNNTNNRKNNNNKIIIILIVAILIGVCIFTYTKIMKSSDENNQLTAKFEAEVYILNKEEGGRHTPFFDNYRPQFYFGTTDVTGVITLPNNIEMVNPGENAVELVSKVAIEEGTKFSIREGGRTVGNGTVTKIYE